MKTKVEVVRYIEDYWAKVAVFYLTTFGFPFELFRIVFENLSILQQWELIHRYEKKLNFNRLFSEYIK